LAGFTELENLDRIADSLAARGWMVVDDFFGLELTEALRSDCQTSSGQGNFREAAVGSGERRRIRTEVRGDEILWLQHPASSEPQRTCLNRFEQLRLTLNRTLQLGLFEFESHFARYPAGAFYARHIDQLHGDSRRKLSCVLYLNENWKPEDGGELRFYLGDDSAEFEDMLPQGGRLVVFLSGRFAHEVLPAKRERLSLAGWFKTRSS
jgi:SM-20-related protein